MDSLAPVGPDGDRVPDSASALGKGLRVLEALALADGPVRISHLAATLSMQKSSLHRVLQTLVAAGWVRQDPVTSLYTASLKTWELGAAVVARVPVKQAATTLLQELHAATGETVSLSVRDGDDVLYLDKILSPRPMGYTTRVGSRVAAPLVAAGRVMLAQDPAGEQVVRRVAAALEPGEVDVEQVLDDLRRARADGYLVGRGRRGVVGIATAVPGTVSHAAAGLTVSVPSTRFDASRHDPLVEALLGAAARLGEAVGAR